MNQQNQAETAAVEKIIEKLDANEANVRRSHVSGFEIVIEAEWLDGRTIEELQESYKIHAIANTPDGVKIELIIPL